MRKKYVQTLAARQREQNGAMGDHHHHPATRIADPHIIRRHEMMDLEKQQQPQSPLHGMLHLQQQQQQHLHLQVQLQLQLQQQKKQQKEQQKQLHPEDDEIIEILDDDQEVELMMERHRKYHPRKYVNLQQPPSKIYYDKLVDDGLGPLGGDKDDPQADDEEEEEDDERNQLVIDCPSRGVTNDRSMEEGSSSASKRDDERSSTATSSSDRLNRSDPSLERSDPNISIPSQATPPPAPPPAAPAAPAPLAPPPPSEASRASSLRYLYQQQPQERPTIRDAYYPGSVLSELRKPTPTRGDFPKRRMSVMVPYAERLTRERHTHNRVHHYPYDRYVPSSEYDLAVPLTSSMGQLRRKEDERRYYRPAVEPPEPSPETFYSIPAPRGEYGEPPAKRKSAFSPPRDYDRRHRLSDVGGTKIRAVPPSASSAAISPEIVVTPRNSLYYPHHPAQLPLYQYPFAQLEDWYRSGIPPPPPGIHLLSPVEQQTYLSYYHSHLNKLAYLQQQQQQHQQQQHHQHNPYHPSSEASLLSNALMSVSPGGGNHHQHQQHSILHQHAMPATSYPPPQYGFAKTDPSHYNNNNAPLDYSMYPGIVLPPGTTLTVNPRNPSPAERNGKPRILSPAKPSAVVSSSTSTPSATGKEPPSSRLLSEIVRPTVINQPSRPPASLDLEAYPLMNGIITTAANSNTATGTNTTIAVTLQPPAPPTSATRPIAIRPGTMPTTLPAPSLPVLLTQLQRPTIIQSSKATTRSSGGSSLNGGGIAREGRSPRKRSLSPEIPVPVAAVPTTNTTTTTTVLIPTPSGKVKKSNEPHQYRRSAMATANPTTTTTSSSSASKPPLGSRPRGRPPGRQNNTTSSTNRTPSKSSGPSPKQPPANADTTSDKSSRLPNPVPSRINPANPSSTMPGDNYAVVNGGRSASHVRSSMITNPAHIPVGLPSTEARLHRMRHEIQCFLQQRRQDIIKTMRLYSLGQIEHDVLLHKMRSHSINYRDFVHVAFALMSKCGQKVFAQQPPSEHDYRWPNGPAPPQNIADYFAKNEQCGSAEYVRDYFDLLVLIVDNLLHQFEGPLECFLLTHVLGLRVKHRV